MSVASMTQFEVKKKEKPPVDIEIEYHTIGHVLIVVIMMITNEIMTMHRYC